MGKARKLIATAAFAVSAIVAAPALAGEYIIFLDENYNPVGYRLYCSGQVVESGGIETGYATYMYVNC